MSPVEALEPAQYGNHLPKASVSRSSSSQTQVSLTSGPRQVAAHGLGIKPSEVSKNTTAGAMASIVVDASLAGEVAGIPSLARGVREANEKIILDWSSKLILRQAAKMPRDSNIP